MTTVAETLCEYQCEPCVHIRQDESGRKFYCHLMDYDGTRSVYLMVPVSDADIAAIKASQVDLRTILDRSEQYTLTWGEDEVIKTRSEPVPDDCLPKAGVRLTAY